MKKILIIAPHFPPSNLAAVHRSRLFALHLPSFGWQPVILTVHEDYYEEKLDWNLHQLLPKELRIEKVKAYNLTKPRTMGDIGLRAFFQLRERALELLQSEKFDFVYIPIPSFYTALIGSWLKRRTNVNYGIDYIDPWVHEFPGSEKLFSRHRASSKLAEWLEPTAVKSASLITGVSEGYYKGVKERNPGLQKTCKFGAMPYGGEASDHEAIKKLNIKPYLFQKENGLVKLVYAGAMLPKAYEPLEKIFESLNENRELFSQFQFHFIGTGYSANDNYAYNIKPLAEKFGLWGRMVFEYPARIPYLDVLVHLEVADGVFVLGSTEPHYTPSKVYQGVLAQKPILAVLHSESTAVGVIKNANGGLVLAFNGVKDLHKLKEQFASELSDFLNYIPDFKPEEVDRQFFGQFSAKEVTKKLAELLDQCYEK